MRKTLKVPIKAPGRDFGKLYSLVEMPAEQGEKWAFRALTALGRSGASVPEALDGAGLLGMVSMGLISLACLKFSDAEPLLDEMMQCVKIYGTPGKEETLRSLLPSMGDPDEASDIEEVETLIFLRTELLKLHVDFSRAAEQFIRISAAIREFTSTIKMYQTSSVQ